MATDMLDEEWDVLTRLLPVDWRELARETGAMRRARGAIGDPDTLLKLLLLHVATGLSLKQAAARAQAQGLAQITDVGLLKRLRSSERWLGELARRMYQGSRFVDGEPAVPAGRQVRVVDATTIQEPGATGTTWRVHYTITLPQMQCDFYEVTDERGGEHFKRIPVQSGDIVLGDRGYGYRKGVEHVLAHGGDVVVRLSSVGFPLLDPKTGQSIQPLTLLKQLNHQTPREWAVCFAGAGGRLFPARLCAIRKSRLAAERAREAARQRSIRRQTTLRQKTLDYADYVVVLTTVPSSQLDTAAVLGLYRARWQIELCFKRLKSLFQLGHVPKYSGESARGWIQGKLLVTLMAESLLAHAAIFSPWGYPLAPAQSMA
ncbi:MAG: IS4 family transposase [Xanthomonadales bacterium]|nr:IS4 family transposase [Xanthomonadales bacterium]